LREISKIWEEKFGLCKHFSSPEETHFVEKPNFNEKQRTLEQRKQSESRRREAENAVEQREEKW